MALSALATEMLTRLEAAVASEIERVGIAALNRGAVIRPFLAEGGKQATLYRWIDQILAAGKHEKPIERAIQAAAAKRSISETAPAAVIPPAPVPAAIGGGAMQCPPAASRLLPVSFAREGYVIGKLRQCIEAADQLMRHARHEDGTVRNAKLLVTASEHMRRTVETAAKLTVSLMSAAKVDEFHEMMLQEVHLESRDCA